LRTGGIRRDVDRTVGLDRLQRHVDVSGLTRRGARGQAGGVCVVTALLDPDGAVGRPGSVDRDVERPSVSGALVLAVKGDVGTIDVAVDTIPPFVPSQP